MPGANSKKTRITLSDVALKAGVSVQTASHVLSGTVGVRLPESTRMRVLEAAKEVGYQPNRLAQAMRSGKTNVISIWMAVDRPNMTYLRFLHALSGKARESQYDLMIVGLDSSVAFGVDGKIPIQWPADGLIAVDAGRAMRVFREIPGNDALPLAVIGTEEFDNGDTVAWDVSGGARAMTESMIKKGCKRIAYVLPKWVLENFPDEKRRLGYEQAMIANKLELLMVPIDGETSSKAEADFTAWLDSNAAPDAIFGFSDSLAIGASRSLLSHGLRIPEDCLVAGYGAYPESEDFKVPISTLQIPTELIVDQAWTWLMERMQGGQDVTRIVNLPMNVIERESTKR